MNNRRIGTFTTIEMNEFAKSSVFKLGNGQSKAPIRSRALAQ